MEWAELRQSRAKLLKHAADFCGNVAHSIADSSARAGYEVINLAANRSRQFVFQESSHSIDRRPCLIFRNTCFCGYLFDEFVHVFLPDSRPVNYSQAEVACPWPSCQ